ncbi:hypothetical protein [Okeania sp. KiyG1]|uniref:hypothetical protein n=1 Tax=Okeania sp. KiyG1 TaxID=2720165 RepID=UPI00199944AB|nr:hypothetical protein [Okeania sp. KiyG1]GGA10546.1 hypothetical protein CYANOKiyG1_23510 [Okeania sp. KiyG1]
MYYILSYGMWVLEVVTSGQTSLQPKTKVKTAKEAVAENPVQLSLFALSRWRAFGNVKQDEEKISDWS